MASEALDARGAGGRTAFIVKWVASVIQILGYSATAFGLTPLNIHLFLVGLVGWFVVGLLWNDRAIILIHLVALGAMLIGLANQALWPKRARAVLPKTGSRKTWRRDQNGIAPSRPAIVAGTRRVCAGQSEKLAGGMAARLTFSWKMSGRA